PHQPKTYANWAAQVPADFRFSVKIPRTISHDHGLRGTGPLLDRFLGEAGELGDKLGGFLLQLPPALALDARSASSFFRMLRRRTDAPLACEPRHASWMSPQADALLARHDVARVDADPPRAGANAVPHGSAAWRYWRWHGSPRVYYSDYPEDRLQALARSVSRVPKRQPAWVIFDNTAHGYAVANAARLQELLRDPAATEDGDA
ncbi:MAG: DUF72 domain-containing protein, partial [Lysobacteraceae bacterium]